MSVNLRPRYERSWRVEASRWTFLRSLAKLLHDSTPKFSKAMGETYINYLNLRISLPCGMQRVKLPVPSRHHEQQLAEMHESANGQMTVTSQQSTLPFCQGTKESPAGRFPSERDKPVGSLTTGTPAAEKLGAMSFREWCL